MSNSLGPYELRSELGRGAMAVVWRAFDPSIGREVAIKEPKIDDNLAQATRDELASRFIREGKTAGQLNHPGIVTIYNADIVDGRPIIVMELIEGETLADLLARGGISAAAAIGITEQLLDALAYAHTRGVVHRDIKPDNVFVTDDGRVKLTDFGIAHTVTGTALTQAGTVMGTPGYMAPEQVRGETVDARADIFAVGVMLHEMLTGENPFTAGDAHPTTIMYRVLNEPLPDVRAALPDAPESLAATVAVATTKDAERRFATAEEMRGAMRGEVSVRMPTGAPSKSHHRVPAAIIAAVVIGLGIGAVGMALRPSPPMSSPQEPAAVSAGTDEEQTRIAALELYHDLEEQRTDLLETWDEKCLSWESTGREGWWPVAPHSFERSFAASKPGLRQVSREADELLQDAVGKPRSALLSIRAAADALSGFCELAYDDGVPQEKPVLLARAEWHSWRASALLEGDEDSVERVAVLEEVARTAGDELPVCMYLSKDMGPFTAVANASGGYAIEWEDSSTRLNGKMTPLAGVESFMFDSEYFYVAERDGPVHLIGGTQIFGMEWLLPTDLGRDGRPLGGLNMLRMYELELGDYTRVAFREAAPRLAIVELVE